MRRILLIDQIYLYGWCCMIDIHCVLSINPLNAELNSIRHLLALVRARHIAHVSRVRVKHPVTRCTLTRAVRVTFVIILGR